VTLFCSPNQKVVGSLDFADSKVTFNVTAPKAGKYRLDIYYGNGSQGISQQFLQIDGGTSTTVDYTPDVDWTFICKKTIDIDLTAGSHTISLAKNPASGSALLDCIDLTYLVPAVNVLPEKAQRYEAEDAYLDSGFPNNGAAQSVSFPSSDGTQVVNTQIAEVMLNAGENIITFSNDHALAPAIDKIEVLQP
jgi:Carbohydrate binding module (family 35)